MIQSHLAPFYDELLDFRRDIHAHPELSYEEFRTTERILGFLRNADLNPQALDGTGVVCEVGDGPLVAALRADIDALPLDDLTGTAFASTVPGWPMPAATTSTSPRSPAPAACSAASTMSCPEAWAGASG